jgi:hypothetical protein
MVPDDSEHIAKGGSVFAIPGRLSNRDPPIWVERLPKECDKAEEAKEQRSRAFDGSI